jgi:glutamate/tyrosine decarboxylase-like PLP-dependent enzyme
LLTQQQAISFENSSMGPPAWCWLALLLFLHPRHISSQEASAHRQRDWLITSSSCGSELRFIFSTHVPKSIIRRFITVDFLAAAKIVLAVVHNNMNHPFV